MKRRFTDSEREAAVTLALEVGTAKAAEQLDLPKGTVATWVHRAGHVGGGGAEQVRSAVEARQLVTADRKTALAGRMLSHAERMLAQLEQPVVEKVVKVVSEGWRMGQATEVVEVEYDRPPTGDQKRIVEAVAILVDKIQLLTGEATSRPDLFRSAEPVEREQLLATVHQLAAVS